MFHSKVKQNKLSLLLTDFHVEFLNMSPARTLIKMYQNLLVNKYIYTFILNLEHFAK